jgi:hypothetical protein
MPPVIWALVFLLLTCLQAGRPQIFNVTEVLTENSCLRVFTSSKHRINCIVLLGHIIEKYNNDIQGRSGSKFTLPCLYSGKNS